MFNKKNLKKEEENQKIIKEWIPMEKPKNKILQIGDWCETFYIIPSAIESIKKEIRYDCVGFSVIIKLKCDQCIHLSARSINECTSLYKIYNEIKQAWCEAMNAEIKDFEQYKDQITLGYIVENTAKVEEESIKKYKDK